MFKSDSLMGKESDKFKKNKFRKIKSEFIDLVLLLFYKTFCQKLVGWYMLIILTFGDCIYGNIIPTLRYI